MRALACGSVRQLKCPHGVAQTDLAEIWAFIAEDSRAQADRFVGELAQKFNRLTKFPEMGKRREQLAAGLRGVIAVLCSILH